MNASDGNLFDWLGLVVAVIGLIASGIVVVTLLLGNLYYFLQGDITLRQILDLEVVFRVLGSVLGFLLFIMILRGVPTIWSGCWLLRSTLALVTLVYYDVVFHLYYGILVAGNPLGILGYLLPSAILLVVIGALFVLPSPVSFWRANRIEVI